MKSDNQNNYWKQDSDNIESDAITEMYTPSPETMADTASVNDNTEKSDIKSQINNNEPVHWRAVEYINGDKNSLWFVAFAALILLFIAMDIFYFHSYTFSVLVIVMAVAIIVFSRRPARTISYTLSGDQGLYIEEKLYRFDEFKSFGIIRDHGQHSIILIPVKRFSPEVSVYFSEEVGEKIVDILGARLPMENLKLDFIDVLVQKLRL